MMMSALRDPPCHVSPSPPCSVPPCDGGFLAPLLRTSTLDSRAPCSPCPRTPLSLSLSLRHRVALKLGKVAACGTDVSIASCALYSLCLFLFRFVCALRHQASAAAKWHVVKAGRRFAIMGQWVFLLTLVSFTAFSEGRRGAWVRESRQSRQHRLNRHSLMLCGSQQADAQSKGAAGFWTVIDTENMEVIHQLLPARRRGALSPAQTSEGHAHSRVRVRISQGVFYCKALDVCTEVCTDAAVRPYVGECLA